MQDIMSMLNELRRPRLLIRAARHGMQDYNRSRHLPRILGYGARPRPAVAVMRLLDAESALNDQRLTGDAAYSLPRHLDVLIALMGEARLLRATQG